MSSNLLVKTTKFPTEPEGDLEYCNGQPGSAFAGWLREKFENDGFSCDQILQEDYGWGFWISQDKVKVWVSVSFVPDEEGQFSSGSWYLTSFFEVPFGILNPRFWFSQKAGNELEVIVFKQIKQYIISDEDIELIREE